MKAKTKTKVITPKCPSCNKPLSGNDDDTAYCKGCEQDVHDSCLADWDICFSCAGEAKPKGLNVIEDETERDN